jgi:hypothetical protein
LFSGVHLAVSTGGEAVIVVGTSIGTFDGDDDAAVLSALGVGGGATSEIGIALIGARASGGGTAVIQAGEVRVASVTAEEGIAGIGALSGDGDTGSTLAFRVLSTIHDAVTGIGAGALYGDTGLAFADGVCESSTTDDGITLISTLSDDRDTGITLAFGVFVAVDAGGALVGACSGLRKASTRCRANKVAGA